MSYAWQRFEDTDVWKQYCDKWDELKYGRLDDEWKMYSERADDRFKYISRDHRTSSPFSRDGVTYGFDAQNGEYVNLVLAAASARLDSRRVI